MSINDGGPAFPQAFTAVATGEHVELTVPCPGEYATGMTLRDYFAGRTITGAIIMQMELAKAGQVKAVDPEHAMAYCYAMADAAIAKRINP